MFGNLHGSQETGNNFILILRYQKLLCKWLPEYTRAVCMVTVLK